MFLAAVVFLVWKCRYGFGKQDESFYLTVPYRLLQGDGLFVREWHLSQMASVLLLPFVFLFTKINGGTEGMIGALVLYGRMRKVSRTGAAFASLSFLIFAPSGLTALSYNSMGVLDLALSLVLLCTAKRDGKGIFVLSGCLFAFAVLCCPYLLCVYILYTVCILFYAWRSKGGSSRLFVQSWLFFTIGAMIPAVLFTAFVLSRASVSQILTALPHMLDDPEHTIGLLTKMKEFAGGILLCGKRIGLLVYAAAACTFALAWVFRKRRQTLIWVTLAAIAEIIAMLLLMRRFRQHINFYMFPLNLFPFVMLPLLRGRGLRKWMLFGYLPGMLYAACVHMTSNQAFYALSSASTAATVSSILVLTVCVRDIWLSAERKEPRAACLAAFALLFCVQLGLQTYMRYGTVFWETGMREQTYTVEQGLEKGVRTREAEARAYMQLIRETEAVRKDPQVRSVLYLSEKTWLYLLDGEKRMAAYSAWLSGVNESTLDRLDAYYALNPDKRPDAVYYEWSDTPEMREIVTNWLVQTLGFRETAVGESGSVFK